MSGPEAVRTSSGPRSGNDRSGERHGPGVDGGDVGTQDERHGPSPTLTSRTGKWYFLSSCPSLRPPSFNLLIRFTRLTDYPQGCSSIGPSFKCQFKGVWFPVLKSPTFLWVGSPLFCRKIYSLPLLWSGVRTPETARPTAVPPDDIGHFSRQVYFVY